MATTSSTLVADKAALGGQGGNGRGNTGRIATVLATAALGLALLTGGLIGQARQAATPAATEVRASAVAGARPSDASTTAAYRWAFPPSFGTTVDRVSAPNETSPSGTDVGLSEFLPSDESAPSDLFDPTVCQYPVRLEPICPDAAPPAPATQP